MKKIIPAIISIIIITISIIAFNHITHLNTDIIISEDIRKHKISSDDIIIDHHQHNIHSIDTITHGINPKQIEKVRH